MTDYKALVKRGYEYANQLADCTHLQHKGAELVGDLAHAVETLRAQLDGMTTSVEYAYGSLDSDTIFPTGEDVDDLGSARYNAEEYWLSVLQRTVRRGPWVEVTD